MSPWTKKRLGAAGVLRHALHIVLSGTHFPRGGADNHPELKRVLGCPGGPVILR